MKKPLLIISFLLAANTLSVASASTSFLPHHGHPRETHQTLGSFDINQADEKMWLSLNGIGPKKAKNIVEYRQKHGSFKKLADLSKVRGMSKKSVDRLLRKNGGRLFIKP